MIERICLRLSNWCESGDKNQIVWSADVDMRLNIHPDESVCTPLLLSELICDGESYV